MARKNTSSVVGSTIHVSGVFTYFFANGTEHGTVRLSGTLGDAAVLKAVRIWCAEGQTLPLVPSRWMPMPFDRTFASSPVYDDIVRRTDQGWRIARRTRAAVRSQPADGSPSQAARARTATSRAPGVAVSARAPRALPRLLWIVAAAEARLWRPHLTAAGLERK